jgi:hypothetical protein
MLTNKHKKRDPARYLSEHEVNQIVDLIPSSQNTLFDRVLIKSLNLVKKETQHIKRGHQTLFDQRFSQLCRDLNQLKVKERILSNTSNAHLITVVVAFVFYRSLFHGLIQDIQPAFNDPFLFLKRIPHELFDFFADQRWRSFELAEIVLGSVSQLIINQDIAHFIPDHQHSASSNVKTSDIEVKDNSAPLNTTAKIRDDRRLDYDSKTIMKQFKHFIQAKLSRHPINQSHCFFVDSLNHHGQLFIAYDVLHAFCRDKAMNINDMESELMQTMALKSNYLTRPGNLDIALFSIKPDFKHDVFTTRPSPIIKGDKNETHD